MNSDNALLERVRKLLAKAEGPGVTPAEAQALTAKAAELMAKYGIDRALLAATRPETDQPGDRMITIGNPWARVKAHLLCGLGAALRCAARPSCCPARAREPGSTCSATPATWSAPTSSFPPRGGHPTCQAAPGGGSPDGTAAPAILAGVQG